MTDEPNKNEGEGNKTAARQYNESTRQFVENEDVEGEAQKAAQATEGDEGSELREAEEIGRSKAREEDPAIRRDR